MDPYYDLLREAGVPVTREELDLTTEPQEPLSTSSSSSSSIRPFELYCETCQNQKKMADGVWVCTSCGVVDAEHVVFEGTREYPQSAFEFPRFQQGGGRMQQGVFRVYIRQPVGYKRHSHFHAHLCRFLANENIEPPEELLNRLEEHVPHPERHDAYIRMHQLLKRWRLPRWYTHIHTLLHMLGGVSERLPGEVHDAMLTDFKRLDYQLNVSNRQASSHRSLSGYRVLLAVMMAHYGFEPHYHLPGMKSTARHDALYGLYKDLLYGSSQDVS